MSFEKNVFINCPFDKTYIDDILKPILYVIVKNGFYPRLSLEVSDSGQIRLQKITEIIKYCKYSRFINCQIKKDKGVCKDEHAF